MTSHSILVRRSIAVCTAAAMLCLGGCNGFFDRNTDDGGGGSGGGDTGNYAYVANAGANTISGFQISTAGALTKTSGSPYSVTYSGISYSPQALTVTRSNKYLYVGTSLGIFGYSIGSSGVLTSVAGGAVLQQQIFINALETSPDGKWLFALSNSTGGATSNQNASIQVYAIQSDGTIAPSLVTQYASPATFLPTSLRMTPNAAYLYAGLGTGGAIVCSFNTSTGAIGNPVLVVAADLLSNVNALAVDPTSTYLYTARSGSNPGLAIYPIASDGTLNAGTAYLGGSSGLQLSSVVLDGSGKYVYVADKNNNDVEGLVIGTAGSAWNSTPDSPYATGQSPLGLAADSTGKWVLATASSGSPDLTIFGLDSTNPGRLYSVNTISSGSNAGAIAVTH